MNKNVTSISDYKRKLDAKDTEWLQSLMPSDAEYARTGIEAIVNECVERILDSVFGEGEISEDDFDLALSGFRGYVILHMVRANPEVIHSKGFRMMVDEFADKGED